MREGWEEINPKEKGVGRRMRPPYVILRPKEKKIYFSYRLVKEYLKECSGVIVRYNRELNMISFLPSQNGERSYKLSGRSTISAGNLFNSVRKQNRNNRAYYIKYNKEVKWLEIHLDKSDEGEMKWLKA